MRNRKIKIDVAGSVGDAISDVERSAVGFAVIAVIFGCLIAPMFLPMFEEAAYIKYKPLHYNGYPLARAEIRKTRIALWLIALAAWGFVGICYILH